MNRPVAHRITTPDLILEGTGSAAGVGDRLIARGCERPVVFIDAAVSGTRFGAGSLQAVGDRVGHMRVWTVSAREVPVPAIREAAEFLRSEPFDSIVAIGGGSTIDLAKLAPVLEAGGGNGDPGAVSFAASARGWSFLALPTTCGTGSEASPYAVFNDPASKRKRGITDDTFVADDVFLDDQALASLPSKWVALTGFDAFAQALETLVSAKSSPLTRSATAGAFLSIAAALPRAVADRDEAALRTLLAASTTTRLLYPRTGLTIAHGMAHPLGAHLGIAHGEAVARTTLPAIRFNSRAAPAPYALLSTMLGLGSDSTPAAGAARFAEWCRDLMDRCGIELSPIDPSSLPPQSISQMAHDAMQSSNVPSNPAAIEEQDVVTLLEESLRCRP